MEKRVCRTGVFLLFLLGTLTYAVPITIKLTGTVTSIRNWETYPYDEAIHVSDTFTGIYTYDSAATNTSSQISTERYIFNSPYGFNISLGSFEFKTVDTHIDQFQISIYNNYPSAPHPYDRYIIESTQNSALSTGLNVNRIAWSLYDDWGNSLSSTSLSSDEFLDLNAWSSNTFMIGCGDYSGDATFALWGTVTEAVLIPEPATLALLALGGMLIRKRKS